MTINKTVKNGGFICHFLLVGGCQFLVISLYVFI